MLDQRTATLLNHVNALCADGTYKIIEQEELLSCFPAKMGMDGESLSKTVSYLQENGYLDVKYAQDGTYCLCPLPEGRMYVERARAAKSDVSRRRRDIVLMTAIGAFIGAFAGSLIAWLISTLL